MMSARIRQSRANTSRPNVLGVWVRKMAFPNFSRLRSPALLQWWEWGKVTGAAGLILLTILLLTGHLPHPAVAGVLLHFTFDFTLQSPHMMHHKRERGRHLTVHALAAGGLPLAVAGLIVGNPITVCAWLTIGVFIHYVVDWTRKFGLRHEGLGVLLDQACHLLTILVLVTGTF